MSRKSFWSCRSGNVGLLFALAIVPVVASIGLAIDYSTAVSARYRLQNAIDATALSLAHARIDLTEAELQARAKIVFAQNFMSDDYTTLGPITVVRGTDFITVNASAQTKTTFSRVLSINTLDVASAGKVVWGPVRVEVAMALDNTGSMAGTKLTELKKAAKLLVDTLEDVETKEGDVKIGLVPFAQTVRVDATTYKYDDWISFPSRRGDCIKWKNGRCSEYEQIPFDKDNWKGCIQDREMDYDTTDEPPDNSADWLYPAVEKSCPNETLAVVRKLGWDFDAIRAAIQSMTAVGMTNVTIGAQWGVAMLSHWKPFTDGVDPANVGTEGKTQKYLILLTDGDNTRSAHYNDNSNDRIDARTKLACAAAKAQKITVYSIRVMDGDIPLLTACASKPENFYNVETASQLTPVFTAIAAEISKLRVSN